MLKFLGKKACFAYFCALMNSRLVKLFWFCGLICLIASCGEFEKVRKSSDVNYKLTKANEYFDGKDYAHANELYKELLPIMKSTRNYEQLCYKYSYTYYYLHDYIEASYHFRNFTETFPNSKLTEECEYMSAVCLFKYAPKRNLDQSNTVKALEALQSYSNRYPKSAHSTEAAGYIDQARTKIESKEADAANLYFNIGQYKAATVAYKSVIRDYPDSPNSDLYQFMIMKSYYKYANISITERQEERFSSAIAAYNDLKDNYPKSKYIAEANELKAAAENEIKKIRNEQHS